MRGWRSSSHASIALRDFFQLAGEEVVRAVDDHESLRLQATWRRVLPHSRASRIDRCRPERSVLVSRNRAGKSNRSCPPEFPGRSSPKRARPRSPLAIPPREPKLKPASKIGRRGNSAAKIIERCTHVVLLRPRRDRALLRSVPRRGKLKRSTGMPRRCSALAA